MGKTVVRLGAVLTVEAIHLKQREVVVANVSTGAHDIRDFFEFFSERVVITKPYHLELVPVYASAVKAKWVDRHLFDRSGGEWKVLRVADQPELDDKLVTLEAAADGRITIYAASELERDLWQIRCRVHLSATQRLVGKYAGA